MESNNKSNKGITDEDYILSIYDRIEIGISKGLYAAPSDLFMKKITSLGFTSLKSFLIDSQNAILPLIQSKREGELAALNISDIINPPIIGSEINDTECYEYQLGKLIIFEMALDIRTAKAINNSIQLSDFNIPLSVLKNLTDDLNYLKNIELYQEELAFLKAEIEKPTVFKPSKTDNNDFDYFKGKTNQFNKVPLLQVFRYFMQLVDETENSFLTKEEVIKFIDKAFCMNDKIEILKFHNTHRKKYFIWEIFHKFYKDCTNNSQYEPSKHTKKKYVNLITSNFSNWKYENVFSNFAVSDKKKWKPLAEFN